MKYNDILIYELMFLRATYWPLRGAEGPTNHNLVNPATKGLPASVSYVTFLMRIIIKCIILFNLIFNYIVMYSLIQKKIKKNTVTGDYLGTRDIDRY